VRRRGDYIRRELAGTAFQLCVVGGLILGLMDGMGQPTPAPSRCHAANGCVADGVMAGITPILSSCLAGALLGMVVGVMVGILIRSVGSSPRGSR
jgi:hypothetical protein